VAHGLRGKNKCLLVLDGQTSLKKYHSEDLGVDYIITVKYANEIGWEPVD
jgi:hypothetical protein